MQKSGDGLPGSPWNSATYMLEELCETARDWVEPFTITSFMNLALRRWMTEKNGRHTSSPKTSTIYSKSRDRCQSEESMILVRPNASTIAASSIWNPAPAYLPCSRVLHVRCRSLPKDSPTSGRNRTLFRIFKTRFLDAFYYLFLISIYLV